MSPVGGSTALGLMFVVAAVLGCVIGQRRGRPVLGLVLGLVLGPVGLLIIAVLPSRRGTSWQDRGSFAAQRLVSGDVRAGVITGRRCDPGRTRWVRGEPIRHPDAYGQEAGYSYYHRGGWSSTQVPEQIPARYWLKLSSDGRSGWVQVDEATYRLPDGHYVDLRS